MKKGRKSIDLVGRRFGKLRAIRVDYRLHGHEFWLCLCDCNNYKKVRKSCLTQGITTHCDKCGKNKYGLRGDPSLRLLRKKWQGIKRTCAEKRSPYFEARKKYDRYICPDWVESFEAFKEDIGFGSPEHKLYRIDLSKGYYKTNCIWAKRHEIRELRSLLA